MNDHVMPVARHVFPSRDAAALVHWEHHELASDSVFYHQHPQYEINLIETGSARRVVGDLEAEVSGREVILIGPRTPHRWHQIRPATDAGARNRAAFWVVAFSRTSFGETLLGASEFAPLSDLLDRAGSGLAFGADTTDATAPLIKTIGSETGLQRASTITALFAALCGAEDTWPLTTDQYATNAAGNHGRVDAIVRYYMDEKQLLDQVRPSLDAAASMAGLSVPSVTRLFRAVTGDSLIGHITRLRIARACTLLERSNETVASIAAECGFANLSHFNRQFRQQNGESPREYRRRVAAGS